MRKKLLQYGRKYYNLVINSIAFYPALIALVFLLVSYLMLTIDFSPAGKALKSRWDFLTLKDASTARTIAATVAAGILSLTVFSFSMVMIVLNQAASNMSNRVLDSMIGNRFQQWILGFYIGTIVYALFLLSTIRDIDAGVHVPALSVYVLIVLTVVDIFLFIYFLHYVTQSVKYDTIIERIHRQTRQKVMAHYCLDLAPVEPQPPKGRVQELCMQASGYFQGYDHQGLMRLAAQKDWCFLFHYPVGFYVLQGLPYVKVQAPSPITPEEEAQIQLLVDFYRGEPVHLNAIYGFKQLAEVAIKALSPGINDPGTAVLSVHVLGDLMAYRFTHYTPLVLTDEQNYPRIFLKEESFQELFETTLYPIWDYGQEDRILREAMCQVLRQLQQLDVPPPGREVIQGLLEKVTHKMQQATSLG